MAVASPACARAQSAARRPEPRNPAMLILTPAAAPVPVLKFRLLPSVADLNPGDAAPIYLRIRNFNGNKPLEEAWNRISEKSTKWRQLPLDQFPIAEAQKFVDLWKTELKQIEFGAHRRSCNWNYALLEQQLDIINISLSDVQSMRQWGRLLAIKVHVEIAEQKLDQAIRTLETGLAFAGHVANGPFFINALVGIAIANLMLEEVEVLITQPGAPNLYWSLTTLPQPFVSLRNSFENEQKLVESMIPELTEAELARPRNTAEWTPLLSRMHERIINLVRNLFPEDPAEHPNHPIKILGGPNLDQFKAKGLIMGRETLKTTRKFTTQQLAAMSEDQIVALYVADGYRTLWDDLFKGSYLPARAAIQVVGAAENQLSTAKFSPLTVFVQLVPAVRSMLLAEARLDRRIAILRTIEALRLYSAAHNGALPDSLIKITEVPVPNDPATEGSFMYEYRHDESPALLFALPSGLPDWDPTYRITIRP
jgi:hypothetical protein